VSRIESVIEEVRGLTHATPFFYTSRDILEENFSSFCGLFRDCEVYYAVKANSEPSILSYLDRLGCGFEAASGYEVAILQSIGVAASKIIYGTSVKPIAHIREAFALGIDRFAADSKEVIEKIAEAAPGSRVFVRAVVDDSGSVFTMSERFGAPASSVKHLILHIQRLGLVPYGISFYVGSQATDASKWAKGVYTIKPAIDELADEGVSLEIVNIGGGFPAVYDNHPSAPRVREIVELTHEALATLPYSPKVIMEPGRAIVATSTVLVAEVISRSDRAGSPWLCLDAGIYNALYEAMVHQGATRYRVHALDASKDEIESLLFALAGPTGDSLDVIARNAALPARTATGDRVVFENAGAYTIAMASRFNGFPPPALYLG
jgi:ornithine decarboxylase